MISIYKSIEKNNNYVLEKIEEIEKGCWVNVIDPSESEIKFIAKKIGVKVGVLKSAIDENELSRIDIDNKIVLIIVNIPSVDKEENALTYDTYPFVIIYTEKELITIALRKNKIIKNFINGEIESFCTFKRSRFTLQLLLKTQQLYLEYLRKIDKKRILLENNFYKTMKNRQILQFLDLQKSLVYFATSLKANEVTLKRINKMEIINKHQEDSDLIEDVIIENLQAIEMTDIYRQIIKSTLDVSSSIISNNLNVLMKKLTYISIILTVPNIISGIWGMNFEVPFKYNENGFLYMTISIFIICIASIIGLNKNLKS